MVWRDKVAIPSNLLKMKTFQMNDGGREQAGYKGNTGDCVCRAIAIVTGKDYQEVYQGLIDTKNSMRQTKYVKKSHPRTGVDRKVYDAYLKQLGWEWIPTMGIGTGCQVHLKPDELPTGKLIVRLSKHITAVIDGIINDMYNPSRNGTRCVYGYYKEGGEKL